MLTESEVVQKSDLQQVKSGRKDLNLRSLPSLSMITVINVAAKLADDANPIYRRVLPPLGFAPIANALQTGRLKWLEVALIDADLYFARMVFAPPAMRRGIGVIVRAQMIRRSNN